MRLHSYIIDHDFGFAPNPFHGVCTLATCKPRIREHAEVGDYVIGTGSAKRKRQGHLVYWMRVEEIITYDAYWADPRFRRKRPNLHGSKKQAFGDNIYHRDAETGEWVQANSLHSLADGSLNPRNLERDTKSLNVLIGFEFAYWGGSGPVIPPQFRDFDGKDVCARTQGHRNRFAEALVEAFVEWLQSLDERGYIAQPLDWPRSG